MMYGLSVKLFVLKEGQGGGVNKSRDLKFCTSFKKAKTTTKENEAKERETPFQKLVAKCARYLLSHLFCV